ncbi:MAG: hypothetical protein JRI22_12730 [Deltaproteobacteria bacterium]|nr:hypothetical protein [Deltaproteobacteria bacterium]
MAKRSRPARCKDAKPATAKIGRPPKYENPKKMEAAVDAYFRRCDEEDLQYTVTGLALSLGFESRRSISNYNKRDGFEAVIARAKLKIEAQREQALLRGEAVIGNIFWLKNNAGWRDVTETQHSGTQTVNITCNIPEPGARVKGEVVQEVHLPIENKKLPVAISGGQVGPETA